jgi:hypothetical protein
MKMKTMRVISLMNSKKMIHCQLRAYGNAPKETGLQKRAAALSAG